METKQIFQTINDTVSSELKPLFDAKEKYDEKFCQKCKKLCPPYDDHRCARCKYRLCRSCDDNSDILRWVDMGDEKPDEYICYKCAGEKRQKKEKKEKKAKNELLMPTITTG